jgi:DNA invertase Pin-like site-specific DNA recombinase
MVVVWKLDRLDRSAMDLVDLVVELHNQGVQFKSLTDAIDTGIASRRFFFHVMASMAGLSVIRITTVTLRRAYTHV